MVEKTRRGRIRNDTIRKMVGEVGAAGKVPERHLHWYGHVIRREESYVVIRTFYLQTKGRKPRDRPKK